MYEIHIESSEFKGKRTVQQHQLVNQVNHFNDQCFLWRYKIIKSPKLGVPYCTILVLAAILEMCVSFVLFINCPETNTCP